MGDQRRQFSIGDTVKLSRLGLLHLGGFQTTNPRFAFTKDLRAVVVGFSRNPDLIRVRRVGLKGAERYVRAFWELASPPETTER